ncbi:MAG TPA: TolC family protein, partial [Bacteroidales bacterium]|nr:TolC family protein [Bacteroidales bacterium]
MKRLILFAAVLVTGIVNSQVVDTLSLERCHEMAIISYPSGDRSKLLSSASEIQQKRLNASYLPQVQINGQASYQSDVTKVDVEIPSFYLPPPINMEVQPTPLETPVPPNDQYRFTMDVYQVIYDGGMTSAKKRIDLTAYEIEKQKVEVELHQLKENVNNIFFSIILLQENQKLLSVLLDELNAKLKDVTAAVDHGVALSSDKDVLKAEIIRVKQQIDESAIQKEAFITILGKLISQELSPDIILLLPDYEISSSPYAPVRPELEMFEMQKAVFEDSKNLITGSWRPKLSGFGQLGYGNPGLNMLDDAWQPFYIVGARLNWQIWNWNQNKKDKQILGLRQDIVDRDRETFDRNLNIAADQHMADMRK